MKNFKVKGLSINDYEGSGRPLIFIHAFPLCSRMWDKQVEFFKDKFRVITYDIRGLGFSTADECLQFTLEEHVNDFFEIVDYLDLGRVNACGLSVGGYILLRALVRDQDKIESVILSNTKSEGEDNNSLLNRSAAIMKIKSGRKDEYLDEFLKKLLSEEGYNNGEVRSFVRTMMGWMHADGICANIMAIATRTNTFYQLKEIKTRALVIAGRKDTLTPVIHSFYMKENLPNAKFEVIQDAGHLSNLEKPEVFNDAVNKFLSNSN